jgi:hypothetical protein
MRGGLVGDTMVLTGTRVDAATHAEYRDEYRWIATGSDTVVQIGALEIPARNVRSRFRGVYVRTGSLPVIALADSAPCGPGGHGGATRWLDFWVGDWRVEDEAGEGTSRVTADLGGCLVEEWFRGAAGYAAFTWTYYDLVEEAWYRTFTDNRGSRREFRGRVANGVLVLNGTGHTTGVRLRVVPGANGKMTEIEETSSDHGVTWRAAGERRYQRVPLPNEIGRGGSAFLQEVPDHREDDVGPLAEPLRFRDKPQTPVGYGVGPRLLRRPSGRIERAMDHEERGFEPSQARREVPVTEAARTELSGVSVVVGDRLRRRGWRTT